MQNIEDDREQENGIEGNQVILFGIIMVSLILLYINFTNAW